MPLRAFSRPFWPCLYFFLLMENTYGKHMPSILNGFAQERDYTMSFEERGSIVTEWDSSSADSPETPRYVMTVYGVALHAGDARGMHSVPIRDSEAHQYGLATVMPK